MQFLICIIQLGSNYHYTLVMSSGVTLQQKDTVCSVLALTFCSFLSL